MADHKLPHGHKSTLPEYRHWVTLRNRCQNPRNPAFDDYGGRGIDVCPSWGTFEGFYADMGPRPSSAHTIDRIDNDKGYTPENCRWATPQEQANNRRCNVIVECRGERKTIAGWARAAGINTRTLIYRLNKGWPPERAIFLDTDESRSKIVSAFGESKTIRAWAKDDRCVVPLRLLNERINRKGWVAERAITSPKEPCGRKPRMAKRFSGIRVDASTAVWKALGGGKPGLKKGAVIEVVK